MKFKVLRRAIPLVLILALMISFIQPVSAATIAGGVALSGVIELADYVSAVTDLPDRTRISYSIAQPVELYYYATVFQNKSSSSAGTTLSYDTSSSFTLTDGYSSSNPANASVYPVGRKYIKLPFSVSSLSTSDFVFEISVPSSGSVSYGKIFLKFYDANFNLLGSEKTSTSYSNSVYTYSGSCSFPAGTVYFVPALTFSFGNPVASSPEVTCTPENMSFSIRFDVMNSFNISGIWGAKASSLTVTDAITEQVNFTSGGIQYNTMSYSYRAASGTHRAQHNLIYSSGTTSLQVRSEGWNYASGKVVDFGSEPQTVSPEFYAWLTDHFTRISDSPSQGASVNLKIYDYGGEYLLGSCDTSGPVRISTAGDMSSGITSFTVWDAGDDLESATDDTELYTYTLPDDGAVTEKLGFALAAGGVPTLLSYNEDFILYSGAGLYVAAYEPGSSPPAVEPDVEDTDSLYLFNYDRSGIIKEFKVVFPVKVTVKSDGFELLDSTGNLTTWEFRYSGMGAYLGVSILTNNYGRVLFAPGSSVTLAAGNHIYLTTESDMSGSGDPDPSDPSDPDATDPDDPDPSDPSDPGGSGDNTGGGSGGNNGGGVTDEILGDIQGGITDTNDKLDGIQGSVGDANDKLDDLLTGGDAGDNLSGSNDALAGAGDQLGDIVGDANNASGQLPGFSADLGDILSANLTNYYDSPVLGLMLWNDEEYGFIWDYLFAPSLTTLSVSILLYFVFGKANVK